MSGHTPGPWRVARSQSGYPYQIDAPNGSHIKSVTRWAAISCPSLPEGEANARLIAASPDMKEAGKMMRPHVEALRDFARKIGDFATRDAAESALAAWDAAIAKAEGRP